jgi:hypothetical protein
MGLLSSRPAREAILRKGVQGGLREEVKVADLQKGMGTFLGRVYSGKPLLVICIDA